MDTANSPDTTEGVLGSQKPDITCYSTDLLPAKTNASDMEKAVTFIEVKRSKDLDCFSDPPAGTNRADWQFILPVGRTAPVDSAKALGQNMAYAAAMLRRQQRCFAFSVFMFADTIRLARWDRAGGIVTEVFSLHDRPELLCEFFWCLSQVTEEQRGYDLSVRVASEAEAKLFSRVIRDHVRRQRQNTRVKVTTLTKEHYAEGSVLSVYIPDKRFPLTENHSRRLLVSRSLLAPQSVSGRGNRLFWAVEPLTESVYLLKDTWRYWAQGSEGQEGAIMTTISSVLLQSENAHFAIPTVHSHGDVPCATFEVDAVHGRAYTTFLGECRVKYTVP